MSAPSTLGYALLGLLDLEARSGYALRQVFASTPMGLYSSSPGAIYPALNSLKKLDLIQKTAHPASSKPVFEITARGKKALLNWLRQPVTYEDVERREAELMLRFSMMAHVLSSTEIADFLLIFEEKSLELHSNLVAYLEENRELLGVVPSAAVQCGTDLVKTRAKWARQTRQQLTDLNNQSQNPSNK